MGVPLKRIPSEPVDFSVEIYQKRSIYSFPRLLLRRAFAV
jgi:hypothetical protein